MKRGHPKLPPTDLGKRSITVKPKSGQYYRCASLTRPLVDWDERKTSRFSSPDHPVLYLAASPQTAFFEVYGDNLNDTIPEDRTIPCADLENRQWIEYEITNPLDSFDATDAVSQREIGADGGTFRASYEITQRWAERLRNHPRGIDALQYASRLNDPQLCLAVFGKPRMINQGETLFNARKGLRLSDDAPFLFWLLNTAKIALV